MERLLEIKREEQTLSSLTYLLVMFDFFDFPRNNFEFSLYCEVQVGARKVIEEA